MIAALDFGSSWIRCGYRTKADPSQITMISERSEYSMLPASELHQKTLTSQGIPFAVCDNAIVVIGNHAAAAHWLSQVPRAPLFADGLVPTEDRPARQMLGLMVDAILPEVAILDRPGLCVMTVPGAHEDSTAASRNEAFLSGLVRMRGYETLVVRPSHAAVLSTFSESGFSGMTIVFGAETIDLCISRHGMPLASADIPVGSNWIDTELARQYQIRKFDEKGNCYLDLDAVREWKHYSDLHLRNPVSERERTLVRLFAAAMDRICRSVATLLKRPQVQTAFAEQRLPVMLCGGSAHLKGFSSLLTERFIDHHVAERIQSIRSAEDADTAVLRGCLVCAELEAGLLDQQSAA
ncbi:MAG: cell division FtsA domain-containing protein [Planctomycetaceae bacterium]|nr:cell division FtsA domain-containing protein [Planctomycetaceae bacterium]